MRKKIVTTVALAMFLTGATCLPWAAAQEKTAPAESSPKEGEAQAKPADSYKVEFTVNELDNGKKINSRSYFMLLRAVAVPEWTNRQGLRVGSKVPIATGIFTGPGPGSFQYQNVGMDIDCRLMPMGNGRVSIGTNWDYSSVEGEQARDTKNPVVRQVRSSVEAVVPLDKPTVISEMDDVASTHRFVFEVKVTKINP
jgi:hypothetical protein